MSALRRCDKHDDQGQRCGLLDTETHVHVIVPEEFESVVAGAYGAAERGLKTGRASTLRSKIRPDRFVVLLACGHWRQTGTPAALYWCPGACGEVPAALDADTGRPAVLGGWDYTL